MKRCLLKYNLVKNGYSERLIEESCDVYGYVLSTAAALF